MNKGVQIYTVRDFLGTKESYAASMKKIRDLGYNCVQAYATGDVKMSEVKVILDSVGLTNCSTSCEPDDIERDPSLLKEAIETAHLFGVTEVSVGALREEWRQSAEGYRKYAELVNRIGADFKKEGLHLMYHPHAMEFYSLGGGLKGMDIIMDETDPDCLHFNLDTHWLCAGGVNVTDWIRKAAGRMSIIHFKDYAITGIVDGKIECYTKRFAEIGEGNLDWPAIIDTCREIGVEYYVVEQDECPGDPYESLAISSRNMTKFGIVAD